MVWRVIEARALKRQGKAADALQLLVNLGEADKRSPGVMQLIAECYGMLSRPKDAAEMYAAASDDEPGNGPWAFEAALWFERAKENARGLPYAKRAAALEVDGGAALAERLAK
jgi:thioredoxin-like negative regulator of GroEL